ncbi:hypothetical protein PoB_002738600 [Plakobranchus ocellatus]|uniref:Uncharacterized protein n=1 Tax=Plakobranchus ocellatus TaxID=259542 RepID=A0AAV3ZP95_9GAST|nr:hypothetical protein PoB_002738600 [Plakobranchus ocellatus]
MACNKRYRVTAEQALALFTDLSEVETDETGLESDKSSSSSDFRSRSSGTGIEETDNYYNTRQTLDLVIVMKITGSLAQPAHTNDTATRMNPSGCCPRSNTVDRLEYTKRMIIFTPDVQKTEDAEYAASQAKKLEQTLHVRDALISHIFSSPETLFQDLAHTGRTSKLKIQPKKRRE